jgi:GTP pyrophosphokinase
MKTKLLERFDRALAFASHLHREQLRKGTEIPYVAHLLGVVSIALEHGANEDEAIAALLHDSIEDQSRGDAAGLRSRIREEFGKSVLRIVEGCTDADVIPKPPWRERKAAYLAHLAEAPRSVLLVSASDKLHNARSIVADLQSHGPAVWERFKGGREGSLWYYRSLVATFKQRLPSALSDQLDKVVSEMEKIEGQAAVSL